MSPGVEALLDGESSDLEASGGPPLSARASGSKVSKLLLLSVQPDGGIFLAQVSVSAVWCREQASAPHRRPRAAAALRRQPTAGLLACRRRSAVPAPAPTLWRPYFIAAMLSQTRCPAGGRTRLGTQLRMVGRRRSPCVTAAAAAQHAVALHAASKLPALARSKSLFVPSVPLRQIPAADVVGATSAGAELTIWHAPLANPGTEKPARRMRRTSLVLDSPALAAAAAAAVRTAACRHGSDRPPRLLPLVPSHIPLQCCSSRRRAAASPSCLSALA